ncbi:unnamed protein product [Acanthosepion pharaonis]|uniref:DDE-1 domain-containing protein n=1 Tax=Acanthosepion pharaonis TaxID=158019 RepID=A0A812AV02_ACAPH|nr:unnamed protein product [Sepia pharaonis]
MHNPKAWITKMLTFDWFHQCFIPQVKVYLLEKGLPFEILLVMDNAGDHATDLSHEGIMNEFLPPITTSLIQPMDLPPLLPDGIYDDKGITPAEIQHSAVQKALQLAAIIGGDVTTGDIDDLLDCHFQPLTDADLEDLTMSASEEEETQQETEEFVDQTCLTLERLAKLCNLAKELKCFCCLAKKEPVPAATPTAAPSEEIEEVTQERAPSSEGT